MQVSHPRVKEGATSLSLLLVLDGVWLTLARRIYPRLESVVLWYGLLAWVAIAAAISAGRPTTSEEAILWGGGVGLLSYAVFNGTEMAIRSDWRGKVAVFDLLWGTVACSSVSLASFHISRIL